MTARELFSDARRQVVALEAIRREISALRAAPKRPLTGRIRQRVKYCFATKGKHRQGEPMDRPPDIDNMTKTLNDLCEKFGYIANDCRVVDFSAIKVYSDPAGIFVRFEEIV
jgi:Holliday junction resolvase RusA-like endonuclease